MAAEPQSRRNWKPRSRGRAPPKTSRYAARLSLTVQRLVMENAFVVPLAFQYELVAMNKRVQGYRPNLLGKPKCDDVWLES